MPQKTVSLPAVRIEPEHRDALENLAQRLYPRVPLSAHVRQAVIEYVLRNAPPPQAHPGPTETK